MNRRSFLAAIGMGSGALLGTPAMLFEHCWDFPHPVTEKGSTALHRELRIASLFLWLFGKSSTAKASRAEVSPRPGDE